MTTPPRTLAEAAEAVCEFVVRNNLNVVELPRRMEERTIYGTLCRVCLAGANWWAMEYRIISQVEHDKLYGNMESLMDSRNDSLWTLRTVRTQADLLAAIREAGRLEDET